MTYIGKESNESALNRNSPSIYNIDKDVLTYFFYNSFRGIDKEIVMINELLSEIYTPLLTNLKTLEAFINENLSDEDITLDLPIKDTHKYESTNFIFIKKLTDNIGHVRLNPLRTQHNSEIENYIKREIEATIFSTKNDYRKWLSSISTNNISKEGIETIFSKKKIDESINLLIPFENKYHSKIDRSCFPRRVTKNTLTHIAAINL